MYILRSLIVSFAVFQFVSIANAGAPGVPGSLTVSPAVSTTSSHTLTIDNGPDGLAAPPSEIYQKKDNGSYVLVSPGSLTLTWNNPSYATEWYLNPTNLTNGTYTYQARNCNETGCGAFKVSNIATVIITPGIPSGIVTPATNSSGQVAITWSSSTGDFDNYQLHRQVSGGSWSSSIYTGTTQSYVDSSLSDGSYRYRVRACKTINNITQCSNYRTANNQTVVLKDLDGDGVPDASDQFPNDPAESADSDGDGVGNNADAFPNDSAETLDSDGDGVGNNSDACPYDGAGSIGNIDGDQWCDASDPDKDGDGVLNNADLFPSDPLEWADANNDGFGDNGVPPPVFKTQGVDPLDESVGDSEYLGSLTGDFTVGSDGSANYSIPIEVPPGINEMQPKLILSYNSGRGNGLVGQGWEIGGLSKIHRCRSSIVRDGFVGGVNYNDDFRFCLNGERLVEVAADEYRLESEKFAKILAIGSVGSAPEYWQVFRRDGSVLTFGNGGNATQQEQSRSDIYAWHLWKIEDNSGNYILFSYENNKTAGIFRPSLIEYTKNDYSTNTNNSVAFNYENRPDVVEQYLAGSVNIADKRLESVTVTANGSVVSSYELSYQEYGQTYYGKVFEDPIKTSRISEISRCYGPLQHCSAPLEFEWASAEDSTFGMRVYNEYQGDIKEAKSGDYNGDGWPGTIIPIPSEPYGSSNAPQWSVLEAPGSVHLGISFMDIDLNGDGFDDVVGNSVGRAGSANTYLRSTGSSFVRESWTVSGDVPPLTYFNFFSDMNGDGLPDLFNYNFGLTSESLFVSLNSQNGFLQREKWYTGSDLYSFMTVEMGHTNAFYHPARGDFNGDGLIDLHRCKQLAADNLQCKSEVMINTGSSFLAPQPWGGGNYSNSYDRHFFADVNGDSLTDRVSISGDGIEVYLSTGDSFTQKQIWSSALNRGELYILYNGLPISENIVFSRINDDNCADLYFTVPGNSSGGYIVHTRAYIAYSACGKQQDGNGFVGLREVAFNQISDGSFQIDNNSGIEIKDIDADGFSDLLAYDVNYDGVFWKNVVNKNHIIGVHSSRSTYSINYSTITIPTVHSQDVSSQNFDFYSNNKSTFSVADENDATTLVVPIPKYVVSSYEETIGALNNVETTLNYKNYKHHKLGYGSLGFSEIKKTKNYSPSVSHQVVSKYSQDIDPSFNLSGRLLKETTYATDPDRGVLQVISDSNYHWKVRVYSDDVGIVDPNDGYSSPHYFPYLNSRVTTHTDLDGSIKYTEAQQNFSGGSLNCSPSVSLNPVATGNDGYDADGNLTYTQSVTCSIEGWTAEAVNNIADSQLYDSIKAADKWVLGLTKKRRQHSWVMDSSGNILRSGTRTTGYSHDTNGLLKTETREPDAVGSPLWFQSTFTRNNYGTISGILDEWASQPNDGLLFNSRQININESYDAAGMRTVMTTDSEGQVETTVFNAAYGLPASITDIDNITFVNTYDSLGRVITMTRPGVSTEISYRNCFNCFYPNPNAHYYIKTKVMGESPFWVYYNELDKEVGTREKSINGDDIFSKTTYDNRNRIDSKSSPFFNGDQQNLTYYTYDNLNRIITTQLPDTSTTTVNYSGLELATVDPLGRTNTQTFNGKGQLVRSTDAHLSTIYYSYHPFDNLYTTELNNIVDTQVTINYDSWGRKIQLLDPDVGNLSFNYNALDLVSAKTDGKGQVTLYSYDKLSRQIGRVDDNGDTHNWTYVGSGNGVGRLDFVSGVDTDGNIFLENYSYNTAGLLTDTTVTISGTDYTTSQHYDNFFRVVGTTYPTGYAIGNVYNNYGFLTEIEVAATGKKLWQVSEQDARGNIKQFTLHQDLVTQQTFDSPFGRIKSIKVANGVVQNHEYTFDSIGNLNRREDHLNNLTQDFCYDNLNRLTAARINGCDAFDNDFTYDALGNITSKIGVGSYLYQQTGNAGPHAVTQVNGVNYSYDANGSIISTGVNSVDYTMFGKPRQMNSAGNTVVINYDSDMNRIQRIDSIAGVTKTTTYVGGIYEKVEKSGVTTHRHYIGDFAILETNSGVNPWLGGGEYVYLHLDHLGSIVAKTADNSSVFEWLANEPWGQRQLQDWSGVVLDNSYDPLGTARGFTGHEHLDPVSLVHMNGRVYDPIIGRFLSPDPYVQDPLNTQSYNRYSYVWNNPLSYTDPSGYTCTEEGQGTECEGMTVTGNYDGGESFSVYFDYSAYNQAVNLGFQFLGIGNLISGNDILKTAENALKQASGEETDERFDEIRLIVATLLTKGANLRVEARRALAMKLATKSVPNKGIYEFTDKVTGKPYVGQSGNIDKRLRQHEKAGRLAPGSPVARTEVTGGKTSRELAEHRRIQNITGGVPARNSPDVANKVDPIGPKRKHLLD